GSVLGGKRLAMIAALLLSLSPWHVSYAQEARMYTLLTLAATTSMYGLARLIEKSRSEKLASDDIVSRPSHSSALPWLAYTLGTALALWTYNLAIFLLAASNLVVIGLWFMREFVEIRFLRKWVIAQIAVLALWTPWIPVMLIQAASVYHAYWIPAPNISTLIDTFQTYSAAFISHNYADSSSIPINPHEVSLLRPFFNLFVLTLIVYTLWVWRRRRHWIFFLLCFWLVAPLGQLFASIWRPIFLDRSLIWTS